MPSAESCSPMPAVSRYLEALEAHYIHEGVPTRARCETHKIDFQDGPVSHYVSVSLGADGRPFDVAVFGPSVGSTSYEIVRDASVMVSRALQDGTSIEDLLATVGRHEDGSPRSILGAIADVLGVYV